MGLSFGVSVAVNNILALRAFHTFLFNYGLHERPTWIERKFILPRLTAWVERQGLRQMASLMTDPLCKEASVSLNDVTGDFFAVLYISHNPHELGSITTGKELFQLLAIMGLEFEKIRKPRESISHEPRS
jgi:hypothetical protein